MPAKLNAIRRRQSWAASRRSHAAGSKARRNQPEGIPAIHRQGNADKQSGDYAPRAESGPIFNFYAHGQRTTPERKDYIASSPPGSSYRSGGSDEFIACDVVFSGVFFAMSFDTLMLEVESLPAARKLMAYMVALKIRVRKLLCCKARGEKSGDPSPGRWLTLKCERKLGLADGQWACPSAH